VPAIRRLIVQTESQIRWKGSGRAKDRKEERGFHGHTIRTVHKKKKKKQTGKRGTLGISPKRQGRYGNPGNIFAKVHRGRRGGDKKRGV